ncbi:MAG: sulfatase-like hydrolase/transferase, partial [Mangrovicoccus sp.]|nr:sulfatase-like hydrolase/transferase [Mangrovicoccus sp.]
MNFLSISVDDLISYQAFKNHFGGQLHTPNIDRLMESGTNFDNAFSQVAKCNPSRTSILSGQRPEETGVHDNNVVWHENVAVSDTLPYILAVNGFDTDVIGKVYHKPADELPGAAKLPFDASTDKSLWQAAPGPFKTGAISQPEEEHGDYINTSTAIEAIENWQPGEQNAVFLGIFRPHGPYSAPQEYFDLYPLDEIKLPETMENDLDDVPEFMQGLVVDWYHQKILTADYWKEVLQSYFACVSFADAQVGRVLDALEATGMDEETLVMLWSDHGYHLGDKEHWHKFTLWEESARAPLVIRDPSSDVSGRNVETPVELLDIMPTALDLLGVAPPKELAGKSLRDFIEAESYPQEGTAYTTMYGSLSIRTNTHRLTIYEDDSVELYDLVADPNQFTNLAGIAAQAELQQNLTKQLFEHAEANGWLRAYGSVDLSSETTGKLVVFPTGDATVLGGQGDDTYFLRQIGETIIEAANGGRDRVYFRDDLTLPENIEDAIAIERTAAKFSTVHGNELDNLINGATNIFGYAGNDWLGLGDAGTADGGAGDDELRGSNLADTLLGGDGNDFLFGRNGDDVLRPGKGNDKVQGTGGVDTVDYRDLTTAVYVDLANQTATSENKTDILLTVEAVAGTDLNDVILGDAHNNIFYFWSGYDQIDGAEGTDIAQLEFAFADVEWIAPSGETGVIIKRVGSLLAVLNAHNIETFAFTDDQVYTVAELLASGKAIAAPPVDAVDDLFDFAPGGDLLLDVLSNDKLPVGDYSIAIVSQGAYGLAQVFDDEIRYLRNPDGPPFFPGDSFTYEIKTSDGLRDVAMVTIAAEETGNQPPVIAPLGDLEVTETDEVTVPISASDADGNDTITLSALIIRPNGIPVNPDTYALSDFGDGTGELVWKTPTRAEDGVYDIIITAEDGVTPAVTEQFTITVRDTSAAMPVIEPLPDLTVDEKDEVVVPISASDADGNDTITLSALIIRPNGIPVNPDTYALSDFGDGTGELVWK